MGDHGDGDFRGGTTWLIRGWAAMRLPFLSRRQQAAREPATPVAIPFTMEDFAEMRDYTMALTPHGITLRVDAMDKDRPEVAIISRNGIPNFELWRTSAELLLRCLDPKRDAGTIELQELRRAWVLVCALTAPAIWLDTDEAPKTGGRGIAFLLRWLRT